MNSISSKLTNKLTLSSCRFCMVGKGIYRVSDGLGTEYSLCENHKKDFDQNKDNLQAESLITKIP